MNEHRRRGKDNEKVGKEASHPIPTDVTSPDSQYEAIHERSLHRLHTARWVVLGGLVFIFVISMFSLYISGCCSEDGIGSDTIFMTMENTLDLP